MRESICVAAAVLLTSLRTASAEEPAPPAPADPAPAAETPPAVEHTAAAAAPAAPNARPDIGFEIGIRGAWALPMGTFAGVKDTSENISFAHEFLNAVPVTLEAGLRIDRIVVGGYFGYGPDKVKDGALMGACSAPSAECLGGRTRRVGAQVLYRFTGPGVLTPWLGAGIGYEWLSFDHSDPGGTIHITYRGMEFLNLQLGGDFRISEKLYLGPCAAITFAEFSKATMESGGVSVTGDFAKPRVHEWLMLGIRGGFRM